MSEKTQLTPREKAMCYLANRIDGMEQHQLASLYGVNVGRVAEAILAIEHTIDNTFEIYELARAQRGTK